MSENTTTVALGSGLDPDQAQDVYRTILDALSLPGTVKMLPDSRFPSALLPALALADLETGTHLLEHAPHTWAPVLAVATGAPVRTLPLAKFVTALRTISPDELGSVTTGSALSPESGATVICAVDSVVGGSPAELTGPGIKESVQISPAGIDSEFWSVREGLVANFPAGIDLVFVGTDGSAVAVPRTSRIRFTEPTPTAPEAEVN